jgi:8-oxo-dGTP pyrophosphatase MutT (NUDIX family)
MTNYSPEQIRQALALPDFDVEAAQRKMMPSSRDRQRPPELPGRPRQGGVLVLNYLRDGRNYLVLTKRRDDLNSHAGQVSFPGGRREDGESLRTTALREAQEEVGVDPTAVQILGELSSLYIPPTDYEVHPFVAWYESGRPVFVPQVDEVAEILEVPLSHLQDPVNQAWETWELRGYAVRVPFFVVQGYKVWGATAIMLSEYLDRLEIMTLQSPAS